MSKILGIYAGIHDSGISYIEDGVIKWSFNEERFTRVKSSFNQISFPYNCLEELKKTEGVTPFDKDVIVVMAKPVTCGLDYLDKLAQSKEIYLFDHHYCHASTAYYLSGFLEECLILTLDAGDGNMVDGDTLDSNYLEKIREKKLPYRNPKLSLEERKQKGNNNWKNPDKEPAIWWPKDSKWGSEEWYQKCVYGAFYIGTNNYLTKFGEIGKSQSQSLGSFWGEFTGLMGLIALKDEGKIVGLAAQGKFDADIYKNLSPFFKFSKDNYDFLSLNRYTEAVFYLKSLGLDRDEEKRKNCSYVFQMLSEQYCLDILEHLKTLNPGTKKLCLSGGIFSNVKINQKINEHSPFEEIFISPGMGDEGLALGAAIAKAVELGEFSVTQLDDVFYGSPVTNFSEPAGFISQNIEFSKIAGLLDQKKVFGIFNGKREWGPRALGNTSILYDPRDPSAQKYINSRLNRNDVMPFAPVVLSGFENEFFYCSKSKYASKFMTICYNVKEQWVDKIPGVINSFDSTARIQICKDEDSIFFKIVSEFKKITGMPILLNTSFNVHGEPIINSVDEAFQHLLDGVVDYLIVGDKMFSVKSVNELESIFDI